MIKTLHKKKTPSLFIKLHISKAFDTASWPYLLSILSHLGFGQAWRNWILALWCTASSTILLNGEPGKRVLHCRGVRQGDPLSPMLFLLAMEPLHLLFKSAQNAGLFGSLPSFCNTVRVALYVDVAVVFICPTEEDFLTTNCIMQIFVEASGLTTNLEKTQFYPIQCGETNLVFLQAAGRTISTFSCTYLGLPLSYKKPSRTMLQPLVQKVIDRLPGWKKNFLAPSGRHLLVQSVLSAMPIHFLTVFKLPLWANKGIDRYRRSFFWKGKAPNQISGGHCLVNWDTCVRLKKWGVLGFKDLTKFGRALRLKWLWHG
jgi:hypothetical protein